MKFCFVILHYKTEKDTIECVESIKKMDDRCDIVIVDNASCNGSIEAIEARYGNCDDIHIIKNKENLGFAAGNNVGYQYAKNQIRADFIAVSNNDIIVDSTDLIEYVFRYYEQKPFHLMGPDIESLVDHSHQNPMTAETLDIYRVKKEIMRYRVLYFLSRIRIYDYLKKNAVKKTLPLKENHQKLREGVQLHGSFVIFSPDFIRNEDYAFRPGTFLYMEESILYQYCRRKGYLSVYEPYIRVFHKEDSSTNSLFKANKEKREFVFKNMIRSMKIYCQVLKGFE